MRILELICRSCGHREECPADEMLRRLRQLGMFRRSAPEPALLEELFHQSLNRMSCAACGQPGLLAEEVDEEDWGTRMCEACGQPIPPERLEILPDTRRCVACGGTGGA